MQGDFKVGILVDLDLRRASSTLRSPSTRNCPPQKKKEHKHCKLPAVHQKRAKLCQRRRKSRSASTLLTERKTRELLFAFKPLSSCSLFFFLSLFNERVFLSFYCRPRPIVRLEKVKTTTTTKRRQSFRRGIYGNTTCCQTHTWKRATIANNNRKTRKKKKKNTKETGKKKTKFKTIQITSKKKKRS